MVGLLDGFGGSGLGGGPRTILVVSFPSVFCCLICLIWFALSIVSDMQLLSWLGVNWDAFRPFECFVLSILLIIRILL